MDNPHTAAPVGGARLAIRRASFAISDCWQSPKLRGGLDHTPFSRRCSNISQNCPCIKLDSIRIKQIHLWGMYVPSGVLAYWISIFELKYASERSGLHQPLYVPKPPLHCLTALVEPSWRVSSMSTTRAWLQDDNPRRPMRRSRPQGYGQRRSRSRSRLWA